MDDPAMVCSAGVSGAGTSAQLPGDAPEGCGIDEQVTVRSALLRESEISSELRPRRKGPTLTRLNCLALIIGLQVGSGIFSAPSLIAQQVRSPAEAVGVFVAAGLLVWTGAASFVELGLLVPSNGGIQDYLRASWGDYPGYLFSWIWVGVARPAGNAVISTIFANYLLKALRPADPISPWPSKIVALGCVASLTAINCLGATAGAKAANIFMILKLATLGSIIAIGFTAYVFGYGDGVPASHAGWFGWDQAGHDEPDLWGYLGNISAAVFTALFCYGGWENASFVAGDMDNPARDLPIAINGAMALVIVGFFLMNASLYICLPFDVIRESKTVAVEFANRTIGAWGGLIFTIGVAISAMGASNANIFAVAKVTVAASQRAYFPPILANLHCRTAQEEASYFRRALAWPFRLPVLALVRLTRRLRWEYSTPVFALLLNGALTSFFILVGNLTGLIALIGDIPPSPLLWARDMYVATNIVLEMMKYFCYMMSVLGIFILRQRVDKQLPTGSHPTYRTYKTWVGNPIIFSSVSSLLIIRGALSVLPLTPVIFSISILILAMLYRRVASHASESPLLA
ncbi:hypothetical protein ANO14919_142380 [Xylariales sp. No.14919]|nr:hypothetical protein ANO14919_142380 [Xylariales sp. No.14919]